MTSTISKVSLIFKWVSWIGVLRAIVYKIVQLLLKKQKVILIKD